jgi:hypothetical protein
VITILIQTMLPVEPTSLSLPRMIKYLTNIPLSTRCTPTMESSFKNSTFSSSIQLLCRKLVWDSDYLKTKLIAIGMLSSTVFLMIQLKEKKSLCNGTLPILLTRTSPTPTQMASKCKRERETSDQHGTWPLMNPSHQTTIQLTQLLLLLMKATTCNWLSWMTDHKVVQPLRTEPSNSCKTEECIMMMTEE